MEQSRTYYVVFDKEGRVLAIGPGGTTLSDRGTEIGGRPLPLPGQDVIETDLPREFQGRSLTELLDTYELSVDLTTRNLRFLPREKAT
jgi:hypothetical protein